MFLDWLAQVIRYLECELKKWLSVPKTGKKWRKPLFLTLGRQSLRFYTVSDDYIAILQKQEPRVYNNSGAGYKSKKAYIGVVLEIHSHKFIAPLTSYKPAQDRIDSSACSAFKLHERSNPLNKLGMIALNNMIPVPESEIA